MSMTNKLGVNKPNSSAIYLMACPVGSYFK